MLFIRRLVARVKFFFATQIFKDYIPKRSDFILLKPSTQLSWIERHHPDYEDRLHKAECYFGLSYPTELIDLEEYRRYPEDYNVVGSLIDAGLEITEEREAAIEAGAKLSPEEAEALIERVAEADTDTWVGHHGFEITLSEGMLFAHFEGHSMGQGGMQFEYCEVLQSKDALVEYIEDQPISMLEIQRNNSIKVDFI